MWTSILRFGLDSPLDEGFDHSTVPWGSPIASTPEQWRWTYQEGLRLQAIGAVVPSSAEELLHCSGDFLVDKSGPKQFRKVINLKPLNKGWEGRTAHDYHKMEGLVGFLRILTPGCWLLVWDMAEAYFHIMVAYQLSLYFGIKVWNEALRQWDYKRYVVLPFGWKRSMYFINKLLAILKRRWRASFSIVVWSHVDDFAAPFCSQEAACEARDAVIGPDLTACGIVREPTKGHWDSPAQKAVIYGLEISTVGPQGLGLVDIPDEKLPALQQVLQAIYTASDQWVTPRLVARCVSKLFSVQEAFHPARPWAVPLQAAMTAADPQPWEWDYKSILVSSEMVRHAEFLAEALVTYKGATIWHPKKFFLLTYDAASLHGWGACLWDSPEASEPFARAGEAFYGDMASRHINDKEAFAFKCALEAFVEFLSNKAVLPLGDSMTAVSNFKKWKGARRSPFRNQIVKEAYLFSERHSITLVDHGHLPGVWNQHADWDSRYVDMADWETSDLAWALIEEAFGPHTWDRFASQGNTRCNSYTSRRFQPECLWPNSFHQEWGLEHNNFVCTSEALLLPVLNWVDEMGIEATVVAPTHPAAWQPLLQAMEMEAIHLPQVQLAFRKGPSGHVEPWKPRPGATPLKSYRAVRVKGRFVRHYHSL
jgi:hypothetical protein